MKQLFLGLVLLISINCFSQGIVNRAGAANTVKDANLFVGNSFRPPAFQDTTAANLVTQLDSAGKLIYTFDINGYWIRKNAPKRWEALGSVTNNTTNITNISIVNDNDTTTLIEICTGQDACDTITINNTTIQNPANVYVLDENSIVICDSTNTCDTFSIPTQQFYIFQNGINQPSIGIVELGGELQHTTNITNNGVNTLGLDKTNNDIQLGGYPSPRNDGPVLPNITTVLYTDSSGVVQAGKLPSFIQDGLISGGIVTWSGTGYTYNVSAATYYINGVLYTSPDTTVTLDGPDATFNRIDVFAVDVNGNIVVLEGVPSSNPAAQTIDPETQIQLSFALVETGSTAPTVTEECIYQENTEWATYVSNPSINPNSTNTPYAGAKVIEGTNVGLQQFILFTRPGGYFNPKTSFTVLTLRVKAKQNWRNNGFLYMRWYQGDTAVGTPILINKGYYGFDQGNKADYQLLSIPISDFSLLNSASVNKLMIWNPTSNQFGFFIDEICMQGQVISTPPTTGSGLNSVGNLLPLFTSNLNANAITFTQIAQPANTVFAGPVSGGSAYPTFRALTADDIPSLPYYITVTQLTDTSFRLNRPDGSGDTVAVTIHGFLNAANGLTMRNDSTTILGGTLDQNTAITNAGFSLGISNNTSTTTLAVTNSSIGTAVSGTSTSGTGGLFVTTSGTGIEATGGSSGLAANFGNFHTATNTVTNIVRVGRGTLGTAANGIGGAIEFNIEAASGLGFESNTLVSKWSDAAQTTRTSQFIITGVNNAVTGDILTLNGNKSIKANGYGAGTFTGTATYNLAVTSSGEIIEVATGGGGGGSSSRFGYPGEDNLAAENRSMDMSGFDFEIQNVNHVAIIADGGSDGYIELTADTDGGIYLGAPGTLSEIQISSNANYLSGTSSNTLAAPSNVLIATGSGAVNSITSTGAGATIQLRAAAVTTYGITLNTENLTDTRVVQFADHSGTLATAEPLTPANSTDASVPVGGFAVDDTYLYFKTSGGTIKKIAWTAF